MGCFPRMPLKKVFPSSPFMLPHSYRKAHRFLNPDRSPPRQPRWVTLLTMVDAAAEDDLASLGIDVALASTPEKEVVAVAKAQGKRGRKPNALKMTTGEDGIGNASEIDDAASTLSSKSGGSKRAATASGNRVGEKRRKLEDRDTSDNAFITCPVCLIETQDHFDKSIFCYGCTKDVNCMDKAVPKKAQKAYKAAKKDKPSFYELVRIWKVEVGPSLGHGKPRGGHFDWLQWEVVWEKKESIFYERSRRWLKGARLKAIEERGVGQGVGCKGDSCMCVL